MGGSTSTLAPDASLQSTLSRVCYLRVSLTPVRKTRSRVTHRLSRDVFAPIIDRRNRCDVTAEVLIPAQGSG